MNIVKVLSVASFMTLGAVRVGISAEGQAGSMAKPAVAEAAVRSLTATVENIDYQTRQVTLKGKNKTITMTVGPNASRFSEVKKGDIVKVDYLESMAVTVHPSHETVASQEGSKTVIVRKKGEKPSGLVVNTEVVTATVEKIDMEKRKATLKMPDGSSTTIDVAADVPNLANVKPGDLVVVEYTRTTALEVSKPGPQ